MRMIDKTTAAIAAALIAVLVAVSPAWSVTNAHSDDATHHNAAAVLLNGEMFCSGSLIAPNVVLTAGHCTLEAQRTRGVVKVTFDPVVSANAKYYTGTPYTSPDFRRGGLRPSEQATQTDLGVIVLNSPVTDASPWKLPAANFDATLAPGQIVTVIGFGATNNDNEGLGERRYAPVTLGATPPSIASANIALSSANGYSQCFGDSGGPVIVGSQVQVALVSFDINHDCTGSGFAARLDTPAARSFLGRYVQLP